MNFPCFIDRSLTEATMERWNDGNGKAALVHQNGGSKGLQMSKKQQTKAVLNQRKSNETVSKVNGTAKETYVMDFYV